MFGFWPWPNILVSGVVNYSNVKNLTEAYPSGCASCTTCLPTFIQTDMHFCWWRDVWPWFIAMVPTGCAKMTTSASSINSHDHQRRFAVRFAQSLSTGPWHRWLVPWSMEFWVIILYESNMTLITVMMTIHSHVFNEPQMYHGISRNWSINSWMIWIYGCSFEPFGLSGSL